MTTTTDNAPRIIATESGNYAVIADTTVGVTAFAHDYEDRRSATVHRFGDGRIAVSASDPTAHATFYMTPDEARLLAQAILDATA